MASIPGRAAKEETVALAEERGTRPEVRTERTALNLATGPRAKDKVPLRESLATQKGDYMLLAAPGQTTVPLLTDLLILETVEMETIVVKM